jgi:hypothetical protein
LRLLGRRSPRSRVSPAVVDAFERCQRLVADWPAPHAAGERGGPAQHGSAVLLGPRSSLGRLWSSLRDGHRDPYVRTQAVVGYALLFSATIVLGGVIAHVIG